MPALLLLLFIFPLTVQAKTVERVIALAPSATEIAYTAGLGDKLVAVSDRSDYPPQVQQLEKVANYQGIKLERIIALQPDLIIAWPSGNPPRELEKLTQFGFNIYYSQTTKLEDIAINIEHLSQYSENPEVGLKAAADFRQKLAEIKNRYQVDKTVSYFYQLSQHPIISVAQGKWPSEVFDYCGGTNVFKDSSAPYPQVSVEQVILRNPDVIFTSRHALTDGSMWDSWQQELNSVANQHVWALDSDWLNRPTTRTLNAITQVCEYFEQVRNLH